MKGFIKTTALSIIILIASMAAVYAEDNFDIEKLSTGVVGVSYKSDKKLKVQIAYDKKVYTYNLSSDGAVEYFPLQMGNGTYKISIYENTSGSKYKLVKSMSAELELNDENIVYLGSVQNVNWELNPKTVEKAVELTKDIEGIEKKAEALWSFVVKNNSYDYDKPDNLPSTYLPVPDNTLKDKTGICYDFSSLYAAMLRSEGIPAKLIKGYAPNYATGYHAWNEVFDETKKEWIVIDTTYDVQVYNKKLSYTMKKKAAEYKKAYEY